MKLKSAISRFFTVIMTAFLSVSLFAENIQFSANNMSGKVGSKTDATTLTGDAYVLTESMELSADEISMTGKDFRYIEAKGTVKGTIKESQMEFTCGKLSYDRETKLAQLQDDVSLTDNKNNVSAKAQIIEYNQEKDVAVMQIDVELKQKNNTCTGAYAIYKKAEQLLELSGNSQIKQGDDTFRAQEITLNLKTQEISLDGRVKGSIVDQRKAPAAESKAPEQEKSPASPESKEPESHASENTPETVVPSADSTPAENVQTEDKKKD